VTGAARLSIALPWLLTVGLFLAVVAVGVGATGAGSALDLAWLPFILLTASWGLVQATVGALIAFRRPENRIGRLLQVSGPLIVSVFLGFLVEAIRMETLGQGDPIAMVAGWWGSVTLLPAIFLAFPFVGILYPDGRLPGPRWRLPIVIITLAQVVAPTVHAFKTGPAEPGLPHNPFGLVTVTPEVLAAVGLIETPSLVLAIALAVLAVAIRWRRANRVEKSQLKWIFAAVSVAGVMLPVGFGTGSRDELPGILANLGVASASLIPVAIGIAILRYRLYEIDRLISRTLSWAAVSGLLVAVFAAIVVALQAVLAGVTQGETLAVAASTLGALALFQPVRRRVQSAVDRRFDRAGYDGEHVVAGFGERLRDEVDLDAIRTDMFVTIEKAVRPSSVGSWLRAQPQGRA